MNWRSGIAARFAALMGSAALLALPVDGAFANGSFSTLPVVGGPSFCASTVSGVTLPTAQGPFGVVPGSTQGTGSSICAQTVPAGPIGTTGEEMIPADVQTPSGVVGAPTNTVVIPSGVLGQHINRLIGGDFTTNLWQRGTTPLSAASPTVALMSADRWWAISASNVMTITKQTPSASAADYLGNMGFYSVMRVARPSGTPSGVSCIGQTLDKAAASSLIGNNAIFSFFGYAPTTFSSANAAVTVSIAYFTAADAAATQAAIQNAGGNSSTFALSASGQNSGITGYVAATGGTSPSYPTGSLASGVETINLTTTPTRYSVWAPIPALNASGTQVTGVGVSICTTPVATTTVSTDYFEIAAAQLQAEPSAVTAQLPNGVISPTGFVKRIPMDEQYFQLYYSYVINEAAVLTIRGSCDGVTTSIDNCLVTFPAAMRLIPVVKYTAGFAATTTTAQSAVASCTGLATASSAAFTVSNNQVLVNCSSSAGTPAAGVAGWFTDNSGAGVISASAEP